MLPLVKTLKLPKPPNDSGTESIKNYCKKCSLKEKFLLQKFSETKHLE